MKLTLIISGFETSIRNLELWRGMPFAPFRVSTISGYSSSFTSKSYPGGSLKRVKNSHSGKLSRKWHCLHVLFIALSLTPFPLYGIIVLQYIIFSSFFFLHSVSLKWRWTQFGVSYHCKKHMSETQGLKEGTKASYFSITAL